MVLTTFMNREDIGKAEPSQPKGGHIGRTFDSCIFIVKVIAETGSQSMFLLGHRYSPYVPRKILRPPSHRCSHNKYINKMPTCEP